MRPFPMTDAPVDHWNCAYLGTSDLERKAIGALIRGYDNGWMTFDALTICIFRMLDVGDGSLTLDDVRDVLRKE